MKTDDDHGDLADAAWLLVKTKISYVWPVETTELERTNFFKDHRRHNFRVVSFNICSMVRAVE